MKSTVAIVGRPNVGKSTLFNQLTDSRDALVVDQPGVTRDRQYGTAIYGEHTLTLVDTGGLTQENNMENISGRILDQSIQAIEEAGAVIWVLDGRVGLTVADELLGNLLRPLCQYIYLAVNKTEGLDIQVISAEFYQLGFEKVFPISAKRGSGISQLMDALLAKLPILKTLPPEVEGLRIAVLGRTNVGKSTLINRILGTERMLTFDHPHTTRDSIATPFIRDGKQYVLVDTAGIRRRAKITDTVEKFSVVKSLQEIAEADIIILLLDAHDTITDQDARLLRIIMQSGKALIIAVNKWDGLSPRQKKQIKNQLDRKLGFLTYACIHYISARYGSYINALFRSINTIGKNLKITLPTHSITSLLQQAVTAHPPPLVDGRRIKLRYAHLGGHNPFRIIVHGNQTEKVPASYCRYLANFMHKELRLVGIPILITFKSSSNPYKHLH